MCLDSVPNRIAFLERYLLHLTLALKSYDPIRRASFDKPRRVLGSRSSYIKVSNTLLLAEDLRVSVLRRSLARTRGGTAYATSQNTLQDSMQYRD